MGITVHRSDCPNVANMELERLISVHWEGTEEKPYEAGIFVIAQNEQGVLASISEVLARNNINISGLNMETLVDGRAKLRFLIEVKNAAQLYQVIEYIRAIPTILEVVRETEVDDV